MQETTTAAYNFEAGRWYTTGKPAWEKMNKWKRIKARIKKMIKPKGK